MGQADLSVVKKKAAAKKSAEIAERRKNMRELELEDLRRMFNTDYGLRVLKRIVAKGKLEGSVMETSANIYYNTGKQDFARLIINDLKHAVGQVKYSKIYEPIK